MSISVFTEKPLSLLSPCYPSFSSAVGVQSQVFGGEATGAFTDLSVLLTSSLVFEPAGGRPEGN